MTATVAMTEAIAIEAAVIAMTAIGAIDATVAAVKLVSPAALHPRLLSMA
jgi:hypothetical protein